MKIKKLFAKINIQKINDSITLVRLILGIVFLLAIASALYGWFKKPETVTKTEYVNVPVIKEVVKIKTVKIPGPKEIVTIEKEKIVEKLKLPEWVRADQNEQAIATAEIPPYKGKTNAVALLNTQTGVSQIIAKQQPLPFTQFENEKEIGFRIGAGTDGASTSLYGRWTFFRLGSFHVAGYGELTNQQSSAVGKAQIETSYRW